MQVELVFSGKQNNKLTVPVGTPVFMIGRTKECHLRLSNTHVSRQHCVIYTHEDSVTIHDLGGGNGTYVNGKRISARQMLKDGDIVKVGTHLLTVSLKQTEVSNFGAISPDLEQTLPAEPEKEIEEREIKVTPANMRESEPVFVIQYEGDDISVDKDRLFRLAQRGIVKPDDEVTVCGTKICANSIQGIVFGH